MSKSDSVAVRAVTEEFLRVFDALDWERFREFFAPEATVFFPFDGQPRLVEGSAAVSVVFKRFFDEVRARESGPPYLDLTPHDLAIHVWDELALVTFHLVRPSAVLRRTVLMRRDAERWRIVHLHASNISQEKK